MLRVIELLIDRVAGVTHSGAIGAAPLDHEPGDHPMKNSPVVEALLGEGEEALDTIAQAPTKSGGEGSSPVEPVKITKITVTRG